MILLCLIKHIGKVEDECLCVYMNNKPTFLQLLLLLLNMNSLFFCVLHFFFAIFLFDENGNLHITSTFPAAGRLTDSVVLKWSTFWVCFFSNDYVHVIYDLHNSIGKNLTSFSRDTDASWESLEHKCRVCNTRFCEFTQTFQFLMPIKLVFSKKLYILCQSLYRIASKLSKFTSDGWQTALKWQFASFNLNKRQVDMMARTGF